LRNISDVVEARAELLIARLVLGEEGNGEDDLVVDLLEEFHAVFGHKCDVVNDGEFVDQGRGNVVHGFG